jgi:exonuclease SbcD
MSAIRVLHAADLHLDSPFEALSPEQAVQRRGEQRALLAKLALLAERERAQLMLLAGDLLDSDSAYLETAEMIEQTLGRLSIPVFIAPGNHDYCSLRSPYTRLGQRQNIHIFTGEAVACVELPELGARIWGAGFVSPTAGPLLRGFEAEKTGDTVDILVIHGDVGAKDSPYNPISEAELAGSGMDYVALGHIHSFSGLRRAGDTCYAWPGCAEGRGFDECGDKGVILADVGPGSCELRFESLCSRRYERLDVRLDGGADPAEAVLAALGGRDTSRDIYRVTLTGECQTAPDLARLQKTLDTHFFRLELRDKTTLRRDLWENAGEDTLRGLFLTRLLLQYNAAETEAERDRITRAARYGLAALDGREEGAIL